MSITKEQKATVRERLRQYLQLAVDSTGLLSSMLEDGSKDPNWAELVEYANGIVRRLDTMAERESDRTGHTCILGAHPDYCPECAA